MAFQDGTEINRVEAPPPQKSVPSVNRPMANIAAPILIASLIALLYRYLGTTSANSVVVNISVSLVLKQNLRLTKHSWEHGVLIHALLELQNPELTVFAGPGHGYDLKGPGGLKAFPDGKLPKCASESGGSNWGRYDKWTNVKGLRYTAEKVHLEGDWLYHEGGSAADAASLGWATLLLERAGASDPLNPTNVKWNVYGEAADRMVTWLFEKNPKFAIEKGSISEDVEQDKLHEIGQFQNMRWAISHQSESKQIWADSVFMVPPFLAAYAVARQNETWLWQAVQQVMAYREVLAIPISTLLERTSESGNHEEGELWRHIITLPRRMDTDVCCHDEGLWLTGNAWALAGIVRVYGVLERWELDEKSAHSSREQSNRDKRQEMKKFIQSAASRLLYALQAQERNADGLLPNYIAPADVEHRQWMFSDAAGSALIASSVYRSVQLGLLETGQDDMLGWADILYNAVATKINQKGLLQDVTTVDGVPSKHSMIGTSEGQSFVLMMFAARRDCVRLGVCSTTKSADSSYEYV